MTDSLKFNEDENQKPTISIQCDWDDIIFLNNSEVWISCKFVGKESHYSKLQSNGKKTPTCATNDFTVLSASHSSIKVKCNISGHTCAFVPPIKVFAKIHKKNIQSLHVADSGLGVSVCTENLLRVWDLITGDILKTLSGHVGDVYKCKFFPSGVVVLSAGADMQIKIWSAETGDCPVTLTGHKAAINDFSIVEKGRNIISVSKDGTAQLWDCGKSACLATVFKSSETLNCCCIGILPKEMIHDKTEPNSDREIGTENKLLIVGSEEGYVHGVSVVKRKTLFTINCGSAVNVVLFLMDNVVIGCQNGKIELYKLLNTKTPYKIFYESSSPVLSGCIYKDNGFFIGRNDGTVCYYGCSESSDKRISLTGSDCDPITDISCLNNKIFTSCRDGNIRQYVLGDLSSTIY